MRAETEPCEAPGRTSGKSLDRERARSGGTNRWSSCSKVSGNAARVLREIVAYPPDDPKSVARNCQPEVAFARRNAGELSQDGANPMTAVAPDPVRTRDEFLTGLRLSGILSDRQYRKAEAELNPFARNARELAEDLIRGNFLTRFQVERLLTGRNDGFHLGQYLVLDYLAKTETSRLYKARHRTMNREVAIKVLKSELTDSPEIRVAIQTQCRKAARLAHPNVLTVLDVNTAGDRMYLVQEFVEGADASSLLQTNGPQPIPRLADLVRQAALGLAHAHEKGIIHGDLTPTALLVGRPGGAGAGDKPSVKISGLGLGHVLGERAESGFDFRAPELFEDQAEATFASDIYSLGCIFHFLLTGLPPYPALNAIEAAKAHRDKPLPPVHFRRPDLPLPIRGLLNRMLSKDPDHRPTADEIATELNSSSAIEDSGRIDFTLPRPSSAGMAALSSTLANIARSPFEDLNSAASAETMHGPDTLPIRTPQPRRMPTKPFPFIWAIAGLAGGAMALVLGVIVLMLANR